MSQATQEKDTTSLGALKKGVLALGGGNVVLQSLNLVSSLFLLSYLTVHDFGVYRLALAGMGILSAFTLGGINPLVLSDFSSTLVKNPRESRNIFQSFFILKCIAGVLLWAAIFFGTGVIRKWFGLGADISFLKIISWFFLFVPIDETVRLLMQAELKFISFSVYKIVKDVIQLGLLFTFVFWWGLGAKGALVSYVVSSVSAALIFFLFYFPSVFELFKRGIVFGDILSTARDTFFRHGKWAVLLEYILDFTQNIRPFLIKLFLGTEAVAIFSVATSLFGYLTSLLPTSDVLFPAAAREAHSPARISKWIMRGTKYSFVIYLVLGALSLVAIPILFHFFYPKYISSVSLYAFILISLIPVSYTNIVNPMFYAFRKQTLLLSIVLHRMVFITITGSLLIYFFGLWGAALELVLTRFYATWLTRRALRSFLTVPKIPLKEFVMFNEEDRNTLRRIWQGMRSRFIKKFRVL